MVSFRNCFGECEAHCDGCFGWLNTVAVALAMPLGEACNGLFYSVLLCVWFLFWKNLLPGSVPLPAKPQGGLGDSIPFALQNHTFRAPKPYLLEGKTIPFARQNVTFCLPPCERCPSRGRVLKARGAGMGGKKRGEYLAISANSPIFVPSTAVNGGAAESVGAVFAPAEGRQRASQGFLLFIYSNITRCR